MKERHGHHLDGVGILAVQEVRIKGRKGDQCHHDNAEHLCIINGTG